MDLFQLHLYDVAYIPLFSFSHGLEPGVILLVKALLLLVIVGSVWRLFDRRQRVIVGALLGLWISLIGVAAYCYQICNQLACSICLLPDAAGSIGTTSVLVLGISILFFSRFEQIPFVRWKEFVVQVVNSFLVTALYVLFVLYYFGA